MKVLLHRIPEKYLEHLGYFVRDPDTAADGRPVFNKTIGLRDTWAKIANKS